MNLFQFNDHDMEKRYRQYFSDTFVDRTRILFCYIILPLGAVFRIWLLADRFLDPSKITTIEILISCVRFSIFIVITAMFAKNAQEYCFATSFCR